MSNVQPKLLAREKWLCAMESEKYIQTIGGVREGPRYANEGEPSFCAIGLGYEVLDGNWGNWVCTVHCIEFLQKQVGLTEFGAHKIVQWNDGLDGWYKHSFPEIAAKVRANPEEFFDV